MIKINGHSGSSVVIQFYVSAILDNVDIAIIESMRNAKNGRTASQISAILEYNGISITMPYLRERLRRLATLSAVSVEKGKRRDRYYLLVYNIA